VKVAVEVGALGGPWPVNAATQGAIEAGAHAGEEECSTQAELGDSVTMGFRDSLDHAVEAESAQVIGHSALGDGGGHLPTEHSDLLA